MKTILLHGLGQTSSSWNATINTMGKSEDILCPNLFDWFGDKEVCYQALYFAFSEYCKQFSEPINICGLSLGGILALQYGIENPGLPGSGGLAKAPETKEPPIPGTKPRIGGQNW